jgi:hypothetical protein
MNAGGAVQLVAGWLLGLAAVSLPKLTNAPSLTSFRAEINPLRLLAAKWSETSHLEGRKNQQRRPSGAFKWIFGMAVAKNTKTAPAPLKTPAIESMKIT